MMTCVSLRSGVASSGMVTIAHHPAMQAAPITVNTASLCAAEKLIIFSIIVIFRMLEKLLVEREVAPAVLLPAGLVGVSAEGSFLAPTGGSYPVRRHAQGNKILFDRIRAALAKSQIVFGGASLVAVALDRHMGGGIVLQEIRRFLKGVSRIGTNGGGIVIEIGIVNVLEEQFIQRWLVHFGDRRGSNDGNVNAGFRISAGATGGKSIGGGCGWCDRGGALRRDRADFGSDRGLSSLSGRPGQLH